MDLTKLPQELIFLHKESIDDYDIDDQLSVDGILYDYLISQSFTVPIGWDKEKLILTMFNDANYLSTIIILDDRFTLHTHSWIDYYSMQWNDDSIVAVILRMVKFYLSCTIDLPSHVEKAVDSLISDFDRLKEAKASGIAMETHLMFISPTTTISCDHFKIMDIHNELLRYNTFKGRVNWGLITNKYNINDIIRVIRILGKDINSQISLIVNIDDSFHSSDYSINWELSQQIGILKHHLVDKGELLSKKELIEEYKRQEEIEEEIQNELFEQEMESRSSKQDEELKQKYEVQIDGLKQEISQLKEENASLKEQAEEKTKKAEERDKKRVEEIDKWHSLYESALMETSVTDGTGEIAFKGASNKCFTKAQMCLLIYTVASIKDGPIPVKKELVPIITAISGYEETSVDSEIRKGGFRKNDIETVARIFEEAMPNLAAEIRKQVERKPTPKK